MKTPVSADRRCGDHDAPGRSVHGVPDGILELLAGRVLAGVADLVSQTHQRLLSWVRHWLGVFPRWGAGSRSAGHRSRGTRSGVTSNDPGGRDHGVRVPARIAPTVHQRGALVRARTGPVPRRPPLATVASSIESNTTQHPPTADGGADPRGSRRFAGMPTPDRSGVHPTAVHQRRPSPAVAGRAATSRGCTVTERPGRWPPTARPRPPRTSTRGCWAVRCRPRTGCSTARRRYRSPRSGSGSG